MERKILINSILATAIAFTARSSVFVPQWSGSDIINKYGQAVKSDLVDMQEAFTNSAVNDLSGNGFDACVVPSDCLAGVQDCVAGTKPNLPQAPGYCVPIVEIINK